MHTPSLLLQGFIKVLHVVGGVGVLVGQNLGAKKPERAEKSAWLVVALVEGFVITVSVIALIWTRFIVRIFNTDPALDMIAIQFIHIAVADWVLMGFNFVLMNCLQLPVTQSQL